MNEKIVYRLSDVKAAIGFGKTKIYQMIKEGDFPKPIELGPGSVGWIPDEVKAWVENRPRREL